MPVAVVALGDFSASLAAAGTFGASMDVLHETVSALGFPAVVYSHMVSPRLPDGRWQPPPRDLQLSARLGPPLVGPLVPTIPISRLLRGNLTIDWAEVQRRNGLTTIQRDQAPSGRPQLSKGLTIPIHLPRGSSSPAPSSTYRATKWSGSVDRLMRCS
jgi:hypothetical protein